MNAYVDDDWPADLHGDRCATWHSPDPTDSCDCGAALIEAGVTELLAVFAKHERKEATS